MQNYRPFLLISRVQTFLLAEIRDQSNNIGLLARWFIHTPTAAPLYEVSK